MAPSFYQFEVSTIARFLQLKVPTFRSSHWCKVPTVAKFILFQGYYSFKVPTGSKFLHFKVPVG
jgi:hypothetical protein